MTDERPCCLFADFAGQRFGPTFRTIVVLITLFNMVGATMLSFP